TSAPGSGYGTPAGGTPAPGSGYGTPAGGTPAPGSGYATPAPGYGYPPGGTQPPVPSTPSTPLPGAVHLGAQSGTTPIPSPSRRQALRLALGGAAALAVAGGGVAWWLGASDGTSGSSDEPGGGAAPVESDNFTTPPPGVAPQPLWHKSVAEDSTTTDVPLLTHDGLLLISGDPLVARDVKTGEVRWSKPGVCRPGARLLFNGGKVFLADGDYDGVLVAYDAKTGDEVWRSRLGKDLTVEDTIAIDARNVYVTLTDYGDSKSATKYRTGVAAISHTTGRSVWVQKRDWGTKDYDVQGSVAGNYLAYADSNYNLTVRNTVNGDQLWTQKIGDDWTWRPTVANGMVFLPGAKLTAVDADTGGTVWTLPPNGRRGFNNPTVIDGVLYASDYDDGVWAVNVGTGRRIWLCDELDVEGPETFKRVGTTLYGATGSLDGGIVALGTKAGKPRWTYTDSKGLGEPWQLALGGNRLMVTHGQEIYALPAV
ncbi:PQQ-binding-like beta-propeller repeat protein, partial [Streptomyces sp. NPDC050619]|uniref:PQQ-binding-like beta-propeller repeat protein n=1 Tax=Streptomyces sp. NPDC050619 TaxID=3157214 RepID=UPI003441AE2B